MTDDASDHREVEGQREDVLTKRWLHKVLVLFHLPADWPIWKVFLAALLLVATVAASWTLATGLVAAGLAAGLVLGVFILVDALLLYALPRRRMSFGPWKAQLLVLAVPRTAAAVLSSLIAAFAGLAWGLAGLVTVEALASAAFVWGALIEPFRLQLTHLTIETGKWPAGASPIELLHISDLHIERLTRREEKLLDLVEEAQPDMILITGDYLNLSFTRE